MALGVNIDLLVLNRGEVIKRGVVGWGPNMTDFCTPTAGHTINKPFHANTREFALLGAPNNTRANGELAGEDFNGANTRHKSNSFVIWR